MHSAALSNRHQLRQQRPQTIREVLSRAMRCKSCQQSQSTGLGALLRNALLRCTCAAANSHHDLRINALALLGILLIL